MREKLGNYSIVSELGRGGMGVVVKAYDPSLNRHVAIKILNSSIIADPTQIARFKREAQSAASLSHPNIVQIYALGEEEGQSYFVMELVDGQSLSQMIRSTGKLSPPHAAGILRQIASGLAAAHDKEIVHRDIKPANIMLTPQGLVKIADFGIAFVADPNQKLTATGQFMGTPGYISPEMCLGAPTDRRSDIFSLGIVYYEMLAGVLPFQSESPMAMINEVVKSEIPDVRQLNNEVDADTVAILAKMVEKQPDLRYQNCHEILKALEALPYSSTGGPFVPAPPSQDSMAPTEVIGFTDHMSGSNGEQATPQAVASANFDNAPTVPITSENERKTRVSGPMAGPVPPIPNQGRQTTVEPLPAAHASPGASGPAMQETVLAPAPQPQRKRSKWPLILAAILIPALLVAVGLKYGIPGLTKVKGDDHQEETSLTDGSTQDETTDGSSGLTGLAQDDASTTTDQPGDGSEDDNFGDAEVAGGVKTDDISASTASVEDENPPMVLDEGKGLLSQSESTALSSNMDSSSAAQNRQPSGYDMESRPADLATRSKTNKVAASKSESGSFSRPTPKPEPAVEHSPERIEQPANPAVRTFPKGDPKVAVISTGDPLLAEALEQALEEYLSQDNVRLLDEDAYDELSDLASDPRANVGAIGQAVYNSGGDALVLIEATFLGERELKYMGRSTTQYMSNMKIRCYRLPGREKLGQTVQKKLEYNTLNANVVAEQATRKLSSEINRLMKAQNP